MLLLGNHQAHDVGACVFFEMQMLDKMHCTWLKQVRLSDGSDSHRQITQSYNHVCETENKATGFDLVFEGCTVFRDHYWSSRGKYE